jgi:hypothetical protein
MRYSLISVFAAIVLAFAFASVQAQVPGAQNPSPPIQAQKVPAQCPPGVTGPCWQMQYTQGNRTWTSGGQPQGQNPGQPWPPAARVRGGIGADLGPGILMRGCTRDSDCPPGPSRCETGACMRGNMGCRTDRDCKYSEFCDTSRPYHMPEVPGTCMPRGGHY